MRQLALAAGTVAAWGVVVVGAFVALFLGVEWLGEALARNKAVEDAGLNPPGVRELVVRLDDGTSLQCVAYYDNALSCDWEAAR